MQRVDIGAGIFGLPSRVFALAGTYSVVAYLGYFFPIGGDGARAAVVTSILTVGKLIPLSLLIVSATQVAF